jgi:glutathione synthase/RimK-type ligase-like ATP-grasp enzyme
MSYSDILRDNLKTKRQTRDGKLARICAKPEQLTRRGADIHIAPPGETLLESAQREAKEARRKADDIKKQLADV